MVFDRYVKTHKVQAADRHFPAHITSISSPATCDTHDLTKGHVNSLTRSSCIFFPTCDNVIKPRLIPVLCLFAGRDAAPRLPPITIRFEVSRRRTDHGRRLTDYTAADLQRARTHSSPPPHTVHHPSFQGRVYIIADRPARTPVCVCGRTPNATRGVEGSVPVSSCQTGAGQTGSRLVWGNRQG